MMCKHKWNKWQTKYNGQDARIEHTIDRFESSKIIFNTEVRPVEYRQCKICGKTQIRIIEVIDEPAT